ncbi:MAG: hypothetical protein M5U25_07245 [Planctomycetota bacterium]|nr:hypothetical protein [Planctomycetota bacterium]
MTKDEMNQLSQALQAGAKQAARDLIFGAPIEPEPADWELYDQLQKVNHHALTAAQTAFMERLRVLLAEPYHAANYDAAKRALKARALRGQLARAQELIAVLGGEAEIGAAWGIPAGRAKDLYWAPRHHQELAREQFGALSVNGFLADVKRLRELEAECADLRKQIDALLEPAEKLASEREQLLAAAKAERAKLHQHA